MQWIQVILFLLIANGLLSLFQVRINDFLQVFTFSGKSTLQDDMDTILGMDQV